MENGKGQIGDEAIVAALREYCVRVVRFLSHSALDPHLYFEKKLTGDVTVAESAEKLLEILTGLIEWIDETYSIPSDLSGIDRALGRDGLPTLSLLCTPATRMAGLVLTCGRIRTPDEYRRVAELAVNASASDTDRYIAERLQADYEQA